MRELLRKMYFDDSGQDIAEYAVMLAVILIYDQVLFRPLVAWSYRFRSGEEDETPRPRPWMLNVLRRSSLIDHMTRPVPDGRRRIKDPGPVACQDE